MQGWDPPCEEDGSKCIAFGNTRSLCTPDGPGGNCLILDCPDLDGTPGFCWEGQGICGVFCDLADPFYSDCPEGMTCVNTGGYMGCVFDSTL